MKQRRVELAPYEREPYMRAMAAATMAIKEAETALRGHSLLPHDAAELAVSAAVRRLVTDGQLPALGTPAQPARVFTPTSHRRAQPSNPILDSRGGIVRVNAVEEARRQLGG